MDFFSTCHFDPSFRLLLTCVGAFWTVTEETVRVWPTVLPAQTRLTVQVLNHRVPGQLATGDHVVGPNIIDLVSKIVP